MAYNKSCDDHEVAATEISSANRNLYGSNGGSNGLVFLYESSALCHTDMMLALGVSWQYCMCNAMHSASILQLITNARRKYGYACREICKQISS